MINKRIHIILLAMACAISADVGFAQGINVRECFTGLQFKELIGIFNRWNEKDFKLQRESFDEDFKSDIRRSAPFEPETWRTTRLNLWEKLPTELSASLPLTGDAQAMLCSLYDENAASFVTEYQDEYQRNHHLEAKLYLILALAQDAAEKEQTSEIRPSHLLPALSKAWTGLYPFCPRRIKK